MKGVDGDVEEEEREGVPLPQAAPMEKVLSRDLVEENPGGSHGEQGRHQGTPSLWEPEALHEVQHVVPSNSVKSLGNIKLDEEGRGFASMELAGGVSDVHEVVMNGSGFYESALAMRDNLVHLRTKPAGHGFGDDLRDHMNEANGPEISDRFGAVSIGQKHNVGRVDDVEVGCRHLGESVDDLHEIALDGIQHGWKKDMVKPSGPGALSTGMSSIAALISSSEKGKPRSSNE